MSRPRRKSFTWGTVSSPKWNREAARAAARTAAPIKGRAVTTPAGICESMENASGKSLLTRTIAITGKKTTNSMMIRLLLTPNL